MCSIPILRYQETYHTTCIHVFHSHITVPGDLPHKYRQGVCVLVLVPIKKCISFPFVLENLLYIKPYALGGNPHEVHWLASYIMDIFNILFIGSVNKI